MLSVFPDLLSYQMVAPLLIRLTLASVFLYWSYKTLVKSKPNTDQKVLSLVEGLLALLLVIGLWTQVSALALALDIITRLLQKHTRKHFLSDGINYYLILLILAISLLFTGPGFLSIDLPL